MLPIQRDAAPTAYIFFPKFHSKIGPHSAGRVFPIMRKVKSDLYTQVFLWVIDNPCVLLDHI